MKYLHFFVDIQDNNIIGHERISGRERRQRNKEAEAVGEYFLRWIPALIVILFTHNDRNQRGLSAIRWIFLLANNI